MTKQRPPAPPTPEAQAFRDAMREVKPLSHTPKPTGLAKPPPRGRRRPLPPTSDGIDQLMPMLPVSEHTASAAIVGADPLSFQRAGVRDQVLRRLKRGLFPIERELDLHGMTQAAARDQLAHFLAVSRDEGCRCVRIVHGKGYRSGVRGPILKIAVDSWLRRHLDVMAFASARPLDGGTGAVYVLLRV